jgi:hypothetical protein
MPMACEIVLCNTSVIVVCNFIMIAYM